MRALDVVRVTFVVLAICAVFINLLYSNSEHVAKVFHIKMPLFMKIIKQENASSKDMTAERHLATGPQLTNQKTIRLMNGDNSQHTTYTVKCGIYKCYVKRGGRSIIGADLVLFNERGVDTLKIPPPRIPGQVWAFTSNEPQNHINRAPLQQWDGVFNYSSTYVREAANKFTSYPDKIETLPKVATFDFAAVYKERTARALWILPRCAERWNNHSIINGRREYVVELNKYLPVDVYSTHPTCRQQLAGLHKRSKQPKLSDYTFYLSFESSLCKDYISEKFWKVLEASGPTIPVALGGLSIEEYEYVAPPNSFIHVRNFTSAQMLASHLRLVAESDESFNYYHQWRNQFRLVTSSKPKDALGGARDCQMCQLAHRRPKNQWKSFSKDFGPNKCINITTRDLYCSYYNLPCS